MGWYGLISIGMAESERHVDGKTIKEIRYFICSIEADAKTFESIGALRIIYTGYLMSVLMKT
ncbi:hypothetical protein CXF74_20385 [Psychromonas sp. Urea-02u-13]|nr:hypothetical protein CXF74_20385 [Psychromonas sp. Urea-02u-13]